MAEWRKSWDGKCPAAPKTQPGSPRVGKRRERAGRWEQGGDAAHSRGQSRAREQRPAVPAQPAGTPQTPSPASVTPLVFSRSPGWPGGALPPIPQRPTGKPGESPRGTSGTSSGPEEGGEGLTHTPCLSSAPAPAPASPTDRAGPFQAEPKPTGVTVPGALRGGVHCGGLGGPWLLSPSPQAPLMPSLPRLYPQR